MPAPWFAAYRPWVTDAVRARGRALAARYGKLAWVALHGYEDGSFANGFSPPVRLDSAGNDAYAFGYEMGCRERDGGRCDAIQINLWGEV
jgi:hypothetical protein